MMRLEALTRSHHRPLLVTTHRSSIRTLMSSYAGGGHEDWAKYAFFNDLHYVRNFVDGNDEFELMVRLR